MQRVHTLLISCCKEKSTRKLMYARKVNFTACGQCGTRYKRNVSRSHHSSILKQTKRYFSALYILHIYTTYRTRNRGVILNSTYSKRIHTHARIPCSIREHHLPECVQINWSEETVVPIRQSTVHAYIQHRIYKRSESISYFSLPFSNRCVDE